MKKMLACLVFLFPASSLFAQDSASVQYLGNEGVMVTYNDEKVLFDPLFDNSYDTYQMVPDAMRSAIMAGNPPYDDVAAVFISHYHGDHFSAVDVLSMLRVQDDIAVFAPTQAVAALREVALPDDAKVFERVVGLDLEHGDAPVTIDAGNITIGAVYIPHSGWPDQRTDIQNIAYRITLDGEGTVVHLGDADARDVHFASDSEYWESQQTDLALPPYWFLSSEDGRAILKDRIGARNTIGVHVPATFADPDGIPAELSGYDLFTNPGEGRTVTN